MFNRFILNLLDEDESIHLLIREYGITKTPVVLLYSVLYFGLFFLLYPLIASGTIGIVVFIILLLGIAIAAIRQFIIWQLDVCIVTDQRLVDVQQYGLFSKTVREVAYSSIDDVRYSKKGVWATLLNYGTLSITFISDTPNLELHHVFQPKVVRDTIMIYGQHSKTHHQETEDTE